MAAYSGGFRVKKATILSRGPWPAFVPKAAPTPKPRSRRFGTLTATS